VTAVDTRGVPGALFGSIAAVGARLVSWDDAIRRPVSAVHRIGFVQLVAGGGATTLAAEVVRVVAARRNGPLLVVDLSADGGLANRLGVDEAAVRGDGRAVRTSADAAASLQRLAASTWGARPSDAAAHPEAAWAQQVAPVMRFHELLVADFGPRDPQGDLAGAALLCDVVCLVAPAERGAGERARVLAEAITEMPEHPRAVVALVDAGRASRRVPAVIAAQTAHPVILIPHDAGLRSGGPARGLRARQAILHLTSLLVGESTPPESGA